MPQWESKSANISAGAGLLTYPVLQAADIVLYQADYVPVGDDQRHHIEITRDIVGRFNHLFGEVVTAPQALIRKSVARIMGLDDPTVKMSKSRAEVCDGHAIGLLDPPDKIRRSIPRAVTDSGSTVDPERLSPGVENLLVLFETLSGASRQAVLDMFAGQGYAVLKQQLADLVIAKVTPIQEDYRELRDNDAKLAGILRRGAERAGAIAELTLASARRAVGLR